MNRVVIFDEHHTRQLCEAFKRYYNLQRPNQGINGKIPTVSVVQQVDTKPDLDELRVEKIPALNGLVTKFKLAA